MAEPDGAKQLVASLTERLGDLDNAIAAFSNPRNVPEVLRAERIDAERRLRIVREQLERHALLREPPTDELSVFVIMPFREPFNSYYTSLVKPAIESAGGVAIRADDIFKPNAFLQTIWTCILDARLLVAEMTGMNANVLYELGLAHAINKPVIMITQSMDHIPADLRHINAIVYDTTAPDWGAKLSSAIQRMISTAAAGGDDLPPYVRPPASVQDTEYVDSLLVENRQLALKVQGLSVAAEENQEKTKALQVRVREVEAWQRQAKAGHVGTVVQSEDRETGQVIYTVPLSDSGLTMDMVRVPRGDFIYGSADSLREGWTDEYFIGRYSVTNTQFCEFLNRVGNREESGNTWISLSGESPADRCRIRDSGESFVVQAGYEDFPVTYVNYYGAEAFCSWARGQLPTDVQWEKAVRGVDGRAYPWGNNPPSPALANYGKEGWDRDVAPIPVYEKAAGASPYGVVQGIGNVWHWTATHLAERNVQAVRGGSFLDYRVGNRSVYRFLVSPNGPDFSQGLLLMMRFLPGVSPKA